MKKIFYLAVTLAVFNISVLAQTQLIQNGGFEQCAGTCTNPCSADYPVPAVWQNATGTNDYYPIPASCADGSQFPSVSEQPPYAAGHGNHFLGSIGGEGFQQYVGPLRSILTGHRIYKFQCDFAYINWGVPRSNPVGFTIYLSNKAAPSTGWCSSPSPEWAETDLSGDPPIENSAIYKSLSFFSFTLTPDSWQHVSVTFSIPENQDKTFSYLIIQSPDESNTYGYYNFFDNVSLLEEDYCACNGHSSDFADNGQPAVCCGFGSTDDYTNPGHPGLGTVSNPYTLTALGLVQGPTPPADNSCEQPWFVEYVNAIQANLYFFNRFSQKLYSYTQFQAAGLIDPSFPNKAIFWDGTDYSGSNLPSDVYIARLVLYNPCWSTDSVVYEGNATIVGPPCGTPSETWSSTVDLSLQNCCPIDDYFQDITYTTPFSAEVSNNIYAGNNVTGPPTGNVIVAAGSNVAYYAGNNIYLKPGFYVQGGNFTARIQPCESSFRLMDTNKIVQRPKPLFTKDTNIYQNASLPVTVNISPNPTNGIIFISLANGINTRVNISIYNMLGEEIYKQTLKLRENITKIDLSTQSKGVYIVKIQTESNIFEKKIVII